MITNNLKTMLAMTLESNSLGGGFLPFRTVSGQRLYATGAFTFPKDKTATVTLDAYGAGISVGSGSTPPSEEDFNLEHTLTENVVLTLTNTSVGYDEPVCPWLEYSFTVTNTGSEAITICEVGYKQAFNGTTKPYRYGGINAVCLLDRTLLETPVTIEAGDAGVFVYRMKTIPKPEKTVAGVKMVSFTYGSDEEVTAMIDAARRGEIDLQRDGGWVVGDIRRIHTNAFVGGNNVQHSENDVGIVISSFEEYEGCGNVLQFDFFDTLTEGQRLGTSPYTGYGSSEMALVTLPALVEALPDWLRTRLRTFTVRCALPSDTSVIEEVPGNKLALRSGIEVYGPVRSIFRFPAEGSQIPHYKASGSDIKTAGYTGGNATWALRSHETKIWMNGGPTRGYPTDVSAVAPFGCL